ncbi:Metalloprotease [Gloeophyllum trabeum ATCC 11539]|uniref:deuterolysin n=1 Tax=Gloeophyllum trabeum (strain ATCC 11539 / FP-39264 / Madison 617) TaxID=670483 RepID=S7PZ29_GLOTA|nr:Metalloprotease [Gloeophyllum trabeum ATCC 11539]EPQ52527.1 Metalloprotease [Gloeophyllum trabeum ATCC 11539]
MLCLSLVTLSLGALALASPAKRAQALSVSLTGPTSVESIDELKLTATVKNTGAEEVKILKYGTVLDADTPTRSFVISKDGVAANFTGIKISLDLQKVGDEAFVTIPAGQSYTVEHEVASLYDFESLGTGSYSIEPVTTFQIWGNEGEPVSRAKAQIGAQPVSVLVKGDVSKRELKAKRATVSCSNSSQRSFISSSYTEGKSLASIASSYVSSNGANSLYTSYFGSTPTSTVINVLNRVANENSGSRTLNCNDPYSVCGNGVIAYTVTSTTNIYFCSIFYDEVTTSRLCSDTSVASRNIRGGTVLHEITHATSGTDDIGYGCSYDQNLGRTSPSQAAINADNYNCFATQVYASTRC